jgi:hypothetical protein
MGKSRPASKTLVKQDLNYGKRGSQFFTSASARFKVEKERAINPPRE